MDKFDGAEDYQEIGDYKEVLSEQREAKEKRDLSLLDKIRGVANKEDRWVLAGLLVGISRREMSRILGRSKDSVRRLIAKLECNEALKQA